MGAIEIRNSAHPQQFAKLLIRNPKAEHIGEERYISRFEINGIECTLIHEYTTGRIMIWFENKVLIDILRSLLSLDEFLSRAVILGVFQGKIGGSMDLFVKLPSGKIMVQKEGYALWVAFDGSSIMFSATVEGIAELIQALGGET